MLGSRTSARDRRGMGECMCAATEQISVYDSVQSFAIHLQTGVRSCSDPCKQGEQQVQAGAADSPAAFFRPRAVMQREPRKDCIGSLP